MKNNRIINISLPSMGVEEIEAVKEPILSGWLTQGPKVAEFERDFAKLHNAKHAIATTSCTTALHLILAALDIGPGDEVVVPAFTWVATANVALYCGATPILCDIDVKTFNLDPEKLKDKITSKTKAIIPVHLFGLCADMDAIKDVAGDIPLIEDAACASGSMYKGNYAGTLGLAGAFSFHPRKSVTTGEGGMITTNSDSLAEKLNILRNHGASISEEQRHKGSKPYLLPDFNLLGFNYRMTDLQGALGIVQLKRLEGFIDERNKWANFYTNELSEINWLRTPKFSSDYKHGWQSYVCYVDEVNSPMKRNELMEFLQSKGISTRPGTHAVHMLNLYKEKYNLSENDFPGARDADMYSIAIPLHNMMVEEDYRYVVEILKEIK